MRTKVVSDARAALDGKLFDSSYRRGETIGFRLDQVIPGWTEGVQLMREGGAIKLVIPPDLAYGRRGAPPDIGPNATYDGTSPLSSGTPQDEETPPFMVTFPKAGPHGIDLLVDGTQQASIPFWVVPSGASQGRD